jgi:hypothetical protein
MRINRALGASCAFLCFFVAANAWGQTFVFSKSFGVGPNPRDIVAPDLDDDGLPEIITADTGLLSDPREERPANDELSLLRAQGELDYVKHTPSLKTGFAPYSVFIANIDAQRMPDIVVACFMAVRNRDLVLHRNLPDNLFESLEFRVPDEGLEYRRPTDGDGAPIFTVPGLTSVAVGDIDHDGYRDAVCAGWSSDAIIIFPGNAERYFDIPRAIPAHGGPRDLQLHDFNGDSHLDIAATLYARGEIALWEGDGKGGFTPAGRFPARGKLPTALRIADVNGDGISDIVVAHSHADDAIVVFYGDGGFRYSISQEFLVGENREVVEHDIVDIVAEDLTGNGRIDIAAACFASAQVILFANTSEDTSRHQQFRRENYTLREGRPRALCSADFNRDGKRDLAVAQWEPDAVQLMLGR